jgi:FKBP-type peptidyl-prolyl cis-trans isomerase 2
MPIEIGDQVKIHYTAKLENGEVVESTRGQEPVSFKIGSEALLPALQESLIGLAKGDRKKITVPPDKGFGERIAELVQELPKSSFEGKVDASAGDLIQLKLSDGTERLAVVDDVKKNSVILDLNHPLAGETLVYDIEVVDATSE